MKEIVLFSSSTCPHCKTAKDYLNKMGYKYKERNIQQDPSAKSEMMTHKLMGVPAFKIGDEYFVGLDTEKIEKLIDYKIQKCPTCEKSLRIPKNKGKIVVTCPNCENKFKITT